MLIKTDTTEKVTCYLSKMSVVRKNNFLMHCKSSAKLHGEGNISMCFSCLSMCLFTEQTMKKDLKITKKKKTFEGLLAERSHLELF